MLVFHLSSLPNLTVFLFRTKTNALNICQKMIEMFVRTKHKIDKRHEFALVVVNDDALWVSTVLICSKCYISSVYAIYLCNMYTIVLVHCLLFPHVYICMCLSCQASPLTPESCVAVCMTLRPMCASPSVSFHLKLTLKQ